VLQTRALTVYLDKGNMSERWEETLHDEGKVKEMGSRKGEVR